ncbi:hypothetical protein [Ancylobacter sp.]|uniref:hypothetical protein n=1 Tax=Ancylobacter sp. TaxID=1872567 RepID=UPI003BADA76A
MFGSLKSESLPSKPFDVVMMDGSTERVYASGYHVLKSGVLEFYTATWTLKATFERTVAAFGPGSWKKVMRADESKEAA